MTKQRLVYAILILAALCFRFWRIDHTPGFNADEAWTPVLAHTWRAGEGGNWITPSGRLISPLYVASTAISSALLSPTIFSARLPAVISGLLLVLLAFWLLPKALGTAVGTIAAFGIATNPTLIAYSRIGWEPSQSPIMALLALFFAWRKQLIWTWIFFVIALITHSTNVFLAPILFLPAMLETWERRRRYLISEHWPTLAGLVLVGIYLIAQASGGASTNGWGGLAGVWAWLMTPFHYVLNFVGLFSGVTVFRDFIGAPPLVIEIALTIMIAGILVFAARQQLKLAADDDNIRRSLIAYAVSLAGFFLVGGYKALTPGYERYALFLIIPTVCLVARALERTPAWLSSLLGVYLIAGFYLGYFVFPEPEGTQIHFAYRTAEVDPKRAAYDEIRARLSSTESIDVVTEDWWTYWPLRYFALDEPRVRVRLAEPSLVPSDERAIFVGLMDGAAPAVLGARQWKPTLHRSSSGEPIVGVWRKETRE